MEINVITIAFRDVRSKSTLEKFFGIRLSGNGHDELEYQLLSMSDHYLSYQPDLKDLHPSKRTETCARQSSLCFHHYAIFTH